MYKNRFEKEVFSIKRLIKIKKDTYIKLKEITEYLIYKKKLDSTGDIQGLTIRMKYNSRFSDNCYLNNSLTTPFKFLLERLNKELDGKLYIFLVPQLSDLYLKKNYCIQYIKYLRSCSPLKIYNANEIIMSQLNTSKEFQNIYVEKGYGGHLNNDGNAMISKWIMEKIE